MGCKDVVRKDREIETFWEGIKREALNRLGWRRSVCSCVGFRQLGAVVSFW